MTALHLGHFVRLPMRASVAFSFCPQDSQLIEKVMTIARCSVPMNTASKDGEGGIPLPVCFFLFGRFSANAIRYSIQASTDASEVVENQSALVEPAAIRVHISDFVRISSCRSLDSSFISRRITAI